MKKRISVLFMLLIGFIIFALESPVNAENQLPGIVISESKFNRITVDPGIKNLKVIIKAVQF